MWLLLSDWVTAWCNSDAVYCKETKKKQDPAQELCGSQCIYCKFQRKMALNHSCWSSRISQSSPSANFLTNELETILLLLWRWFPPSSAPAVPPPVAPVSGLDLTRYSNPLILVYISLTINSIFALDDCCSYEDSIASFALVHPWQLPRTSLKSQTLYWSCLTQTVMYNHPTIISPILIVAGLCFNSQDPFQVATLDNHNSIFSFHFLWNLHVFCYRSPHKQNLSFQCSWMITTATTAPNKLWTMLEPWYIDWYWRQYLPDGTPYVDWYCRTDQTGMTWCNTALVPVPAWWNPGI